MDKLGVTILLPYHQLTSKIRASSSPWPGACQNGGRGRIFGSADLNHQTKYLSN